MKKYKKVISIGVVILIVVTSFLLGRSSKTENEYLEDKPKQIKEENTLSMMIEQTAGAGDYKMESRTSWPTDGYVFNATLSKCENGNELAWDEEKKVVTMTGNMSDKCYVYFDVYVAPPDVTIAANNLPTTYGKLGNVDCTDGTAVYNQRYNRIEISQISGKYATCSLNYSDSTSKANLASYITGLAGTTQGTGKVVEETATVPNYSSTTTLSLSSYTSQSMFYSKTGYSSGTEVTGVFTFSGSKWSNVASEMTVDSTSDTTVGFYYLQFTPSTSGYYKFCYNMGSASNNTMGVEVNGSGKYSQWGSGSGCQEIGYVSSSSNIRVYQRVYGTTSNTYVASFSFWFTYTTSVNTYDAGIRYEGKNPNNYVWYNNEYWRIIGVFGSESHGQSNQNLVKIIRDDPLDGLVWNTTDSNDWSSSTLNSLLNDAYYNATDGTGSGYCYGFYSKVSSYCDYRVKGIQSGYRNMIKNVNWYLGSYSSSTTTIDNLYSYERNTTSSSSGYIGLMYASDYGYTMLSSNCSRSNNIISYSNSSCAGQSWLYGKGYEWTLTRSSSYYVFNISSYGGISYDILPTNGYGSVFRPVLYLDSSVYKIDGDGTISNPYVLS